MRGRWAMALLAAVWMAAPAAAGEVARRPVVAELFTSEGCSSCPPADALLSDLARTRPDVLALAFHVTYWDRLGWPDPFALPAATQRQRTYMTLLGLDTVYTPQLVVDGRLDVVGSDRAAVLAALRSAAAGSDTPVELTLHRTAGGVSVAAGAGSGRGAIVLFGFDPRHRTAVPRGENAGRTLVEANVVREVRVLAAWDGRPLRVAAAMPAGERLAALVQAADGRILGAAVLP